MEHWLNTGEVAERLGVTPARIRQLSKERGRAGDFPAPRAYTVMGGNHMKLWRPADIERWAHEGDRALGRPRLTSAVT